jgi:hypothetical protein
MEFQVNAKFRENLSSGSKVKKGSTGKHTRTQKQA